jgi:hypothetical protein
MNDEIKKEIRHLLKSGNIEFIKFIKMCMPSCEECKHQTQGYTHTFGRGYSFNCAKGVCYDSYDTTVCDLFEQKYDVD